MTTCVTLSVGLSVGAPEAPAPVVAPRVFVYGIGGSNDPESANIPNKVRGQLIYDELGEYYRSLEPGTDQYVPIKYPAGIPVDPSVAKAVPTLDKAVKSHLGSPGVVVGYSEGAVVAEYLRRRYQRQHTEDPEHTPAPNDLSFLIVAGPSLPNGGVYARFGFGIVPGFTTTGPARPAAYDTTYVTVQYEPIADFPAYFNLLALANTLAAYFYSHFDPSYDAADLNADSEVKVKTVTNTEGGLDTYVYIPVEHLQLLEPVRIIARLTNTSAYVEPLLGAIEPVLRLRVDMAYTDRENLNPDRHVPFSLFTPPEKFIEAAEALPDAIAQGVANFRDGVAKLAPKRAARVDEPSDRPVDLELRSSARKNPDGALSRTRSPRADALEKPGLRAVGRPHHLERHPSLGVRPKRVTRPLTPDPRAKRSEPALRDAA